MKKKFLTFFISFAFIFSVSNFAFANGEVPNTSAVEKFSSSNVDENKFECEANCVLSIGQNCKSAYHIQRCGKRFQASPLDWMRDYSLDTALHLFKTKFLDFFDEVQEIGVYYNYEKNIYEKHVKDTKNEILSVHHFSAYKPLNEEHKKFREIMLNRASKIDNILNDSDSIALLYSHECMDSKFPEDGKLTEFLKEFSKIYANKKIFLIVTKIDTVNDIEKKVLFEEHNLKIIKFTFRDCGSNWTGDHDAWDQVMKNIKLVKNN